MKKKSFAKQYSNFSKMKEFRANVLKSYSRKLGDVKDGDFDALFKSGLLPCDRKEVDRKLEIANKNLSKILHHKFCTKIAISGSTAVGCPRVDDDIDIFVIVRDNTLWLYRMWFKLFGGKAVARRLDNVRKDKFCVNFIVEESALDNVINNSVFYQHEMACLITLWEASEPTKPISSAIKVANLFAYWLQMLSRLVFGGHVVHDMRVVQEWK